MKKITLLLASVGAAALLAGATFAAWAVTDNADPIGVKVTPGTLQDDDTKYATLTWGSSTKLSNISEIKVAENRKVGTLELLTDGEEYTGDLSFEIKHESPAGKTEGAFLKDYLEVNLYAGKVDLEEDGSLPAVNGRVLNMKAQYNETEKVYTATIDGKGFKHAVQGQEGKFEGNFYSLFVTLDNASNPVYSQIKEDVVYLRADWSPKSGDISTSKTLYATKQSGWADMYCYAWEGNKMNHEWPGIKMNQYQGSVFSVEVPNAFTNVIFNDGVNDGNKTEELSLVSFDATKPWYDIANKTWGAVPAELTYKIVGSFCDWKFADGLTLTANTEVPGEYYLMHQHLDKDVGIKAMDSDGKWYPDGGDNYLITESAYYDIYFRPAGNTVWGYFYLHLAKSESQTA